MKIKIITTAILLQLCLLTSKGQNYLSYELFVYLKAVNSPDIKTSGYLLGDLEYVKIGDDNYSIQKGNETYYSYDRTSEDLEETDDLSIITDTRTGKIKSLVAYVYGPEIFAEFMGLLGYRKASIISKISGDDFIFKVNGYNELIRIKREMDSGKSLVTMTITR